MTGYKDRRHMSTTTENLNLVKPDGDEYPDISVINGNMDTLDAAVGEVDYATDGDLQAQVNALQAQVNALQALASKWITTGNVTGFVVYAGQTKTIQINEGSDGPAVRFFIGASGVRFQSRTSPSSEWVTVNNFY